MLSCVISIFVSYQCLYRIEYCIISSFHGKPPGCLDNVFDIYHQTSNISRTGWAITFLMTYCSWSITCRYIFILDLAPGFNGLGKDNCKTRRETFSFGTCCVFIRCWTVVNFQVYFPYTYGTRILSSYHTAVSAFNDAGSPADSIGDCSLYISYF